MQIIQKIRDKGAAIVIAVIALSLIGFILMDANLGLSRNSGGDRSSIGKINGKTVETQEFQDKIEAVEKQNGGRITGSQVYQLRQNIWDRIVFEKVIESEFEKLGLTFTSKELNAIIFSEDAPQDLKRSFTDNEGKYDISKVQQWLQQAKKAKNGEAKDQAVALIDQITLQTLYNKYSGLISASAYYPTWMKDKDAAESKTFASISYTAIPYSVINDSTIKVSDQDITDYVAKHKARYQQEAGRQVAYVGFSTNPSGTDSAAAFESVANLKAAFAADTTEKLFVSKNMSSRDFEDIYVLKSAITGSQKDTLASLPTGTVYGPYLDGNEFVIAKMLGSKMLADSIKCRHILIATADRQTGQPLMADSVAKKRIDSIQLAIQGGASFDDMEARYSADSAAHKEKGVMTFPTSAIQNKETFAPEFGNFLLNENGETRKAVKTNFGWHYIEILEKKNPSPAYKIAYVARNIAASPETMNLANAKASKLSGEAKDVKGFDAFVAKEKLQKYDGAAVLKENDYAVGPLQDARQLVKWAFEAKEGQVSEPFNIGEQFVVAVVTKVVAAGLPDAKTARPQVEFYVRNEKKAAQIKTKLAGVQSVEAAAAVYNVTVATAGADSTLTFSSAAINNVLAEPKLIGAVFNKANQTKLSEPIEGNSGVYVFKVTASGTKNIDAAIADKSKMLMQQLGGWYEGLKKIADIKDERSKIN
jgi:peptidyl-prolyl cis-trans isomerase D